jgi:hypothetical protein
MRLLSVEYVRSSKQPILSWAAAAIGHCSLRTQKSTFSFIQEIAFFHLLKVFYVLNIRQDNLTSCRQIVLRWRHFAVVKTTVPKIKATFMWVIISFQTRSAWEQNIKIKMLFSRLNIRILED